MLEVGCERRLGDVTQTGRLEQFSQVTLARAGQVRFVGHLRVERPGRLPEQPERSETARMVPDAGRDDAASARDAGHLGQARGGIRHEVHDELRQSRVE